ncbi:MAG TPA: PHP domain-containing protein, partial [Methanosarcina vacuolata]|nr:PHP domain-containing protein [Methanosarcina vacuolata]
NHVVLLAKNDVGYANILKLTSIANIDGFYYEPRIDWKLLEEHHDGLICMSACLGGEIGRMIRDEYPEPKIMELVDHYRQVFGEDFYLEVAKMVDDESLKNFFEMLAGYERSHYELIDEFLEEITSFRMQT